MESANQPLTSLPKLVLIQIFYYLELSEVESLIHSCRTFLDLFNAHSIIFKQIVGLPTNIENEIKCVQSWNENAKGGFYDDPAIRRKALAFLARPKTEQFLDLFVHKSDARQDLNCFKCTHQGAFLSSKKKNYCGLMNTDGTATITGVVMPFNHKENEKLTDLYSTVKVQYEDPESHEKEWEIEAYEDPTNSNFEELNIRKTYPYASISKFKMVDNDSYISPVSTLAIFVHNTKLNSFKHFDFVTGLKVKDKVLEMAKARGLVVKQHGITTNESSPVAEDEFWPVEYVEFDLSKQSSRTEDSNESEDEEAPRLLAWLSMPNYKYGKTYDYAFSQQIYTRLVTVKMLDCTKKFCQDWNRYNIDSNKLLFSGHLLDSDIYYE